MNKKGIFDSKKRKGAIALSVSAIVILILAIVILGLGLGFIRGMFGKVSKQIEQQIDTEPEPPNPSANSAITLSRESIITYAGSKEVVKVSAYNPTNETWTSAAPAITCDAPLTITSQEVNARTINQGDLETFNLLFGIPQGAPADTYLCQIGLNNYQQDLTIKVVE